MKVGEKRRAEAYDDTVTLSLDKKQLRHFFRISIDVGWCASWDS